MTKFAITGRNDGVFYGIYDGETPEAALKKLLKDAGANDKANIGDWVVEDATMIEVKNPWSGELVEIDPESLCAEAFFDLLPDDVVSSVSGVYDNDADSLRAAAWLLGQEKAGSIFLS